VATGNASAIPQARPRVRDVGWLMAAAAAMGTLGPVAGVAYAEGVGASTFSALRAGIGAAILGGLLVAGLQPAIALGRVPPRERAMLVLAAVVNGTMNLALFLAFGAMAVGLVMAVYYTYPAIVAGTAAVLGREPMTRWRLAALAFAGAGIALILAERIGPGAQPTLAGVALAATAAAGQAAYLLVVRGGFDSVPPVQATGVVLVGVLAVSGAAALLLDGATLASGWVVEPVAWLAIACAGTLGALPKAWIVGGVRRVGSTRAALALLTEPVVAVAAAELLLGQRLSALQLAGGAAILVAVVAASVPARRVPVEPGEAAPGPLAGEPLEPAGRP
jgi:drug/metabolite transporter (DMT)-like permease